MPLLNNRYECLQDLGAGGFGRVRKCRDTLTGNLVAIKTILSRHVNSESSRLVRELDILNACSHGHPRVVPVIDMFCTASMPSWTFGDEDANGYGGSPPALSPTGFQLQEPLSPSAPPPLQPSMDFDVHIVMPLMRGDLHGFTKDIRSSDFLNIPQRDEFERAVCVVFAFHMLFGLDFVHKCGIVHRDIKPQNILVHVDPSSPYECGAMIADFGLAREVSQDAEAYPPSMYVVTRDYRPPEIISRTATTTDTSIDIWSIGCVLFELVTTSRGRRRRGLIQLETSRNLEGQIQSAKVSDQLRAIIDVVGTPSAAEVQKYVSHGFYAKFLLGLSPSKSTVAERIKESWRINGVSAEEQNLWIDLICSCMKFFPEQRPTAEQLCRHPLFQRYGVFYGQSLFQEPTPRYVPVAPSRLVAENKAKILNLVDRIVRDRQSLRANSATSAQPIAPTQKPDVHDHPRNTSTCEGDPQANQPVAYLPPIADEELRFKYGSIPITSASQVQDVTAHVLQDLLQERDQERFQQLSYLLNYLMMLVPQQTDSNVLASLQSLGDAKNDLE